MCLQADGYYINGLDKVLGKIRLSQWRTSDESCTVSSGFDGGGDYCFAEYCPSGELCFPTEDEAAFGPNKMYGYKKNVHYEAIPVCVPTRLCAAMKSPESN